MADDDDNGEKSHDPTQKKLDDARKKGEIPRSTDLNTSAAYAGLLLTVITVGASSLSDMGTVMANLLDRADTLAPIWFDASGSTMTSGLIAALAWPILAWFGIPASVVLLTIIAQRSFVVAPEKIQPKLNRISILANAGNKFGRSGLFEFFKSTVKLIVISFVLGLFLFWRLPEIIASSNLEPAKTLVILADLIVDFLAMVLVIALSIGAIDFLWQSQEHIRKNRMSYKELTDESKQSEGDPHLKQQRRQRGYEIAMNSMLADVPGADVVIVNPTHYAVALKWSRAPGEAPVCVAKGVDEIAARIREIAAESAIPIHRDPPTARAIHASVELGQEIRGEHYQPVAAAIRFAEMVRSKAKGDAR